MTISRISRAARLLALPAILALSLPATLRPEPIPVRYQQGTARVFLLLKSSDGKTLAHGDLTEVARGSVVHIRAVFHFRDGSLDTETAAFSQHRVFRLLSDHLVQRGPSFPQRVDLVIDPPENKIELRSVDHGKVTTKIEPMKLPDDLANGILLPLMTNVRTEDSPIKLSYLALTPKPRLLTLLVAPQGKAEFSVGGVRQGATLLDVKLKLGGLEGVLAPIVGKQPPDLYFWIMEKPIPAFAMAQGPLYVGGPSWKIEMASPVPLQ